MRAESVNGSLSFFFLKRDEGGREGFTTFATIVSVVVFFVFVSYKVVLPCPPPPLPASFGCPHPTPPLSRFSVLFFFFGPCSAWPRTFHFCIPSSFSLLASSCSLVHAFGGCVHRLAGGGRKGGEKHARPRVTREIEEEEYIYIYITKEGGSRKKRSTSIRGEAGEGGGVAQRSVMEGGKQGGRSSTEASTKIEKR